MTPNPVTPTPGDIDAAPDPTTPVLTVARWDPDDDVVVAVHRTPDGLTLTRDGHEPQPITGGLATALRTTGALGLGAEPLIVTFDERAGVHTDDVLAIVREHSPDFVPDDTDWALKRACGWDEPLLTVAGTAYAVLATDGAYEFVAVPDDWSSAMDVLFEISAWESGSMCGGWSHWRIGRLPSGTLVRYEEINENPGTFRAFESATMSDVDAVQAFIDDIDTYYMLMAAKFFWAAIRAGRVASTADELDPDESPSLVLDGWCGLTDAECDELADRIERRRPEMVAALRDRFAELDAEGAGAAGG